METLTDVLNALEKHDEGKSTQLGSIVERFEDRGFGPLLLGPALLALLPTGMIPGIPSIAGLLLFTIAVQIAFGRRHPWVPERLAKLDIEDKKLHRAVDKSKPYTQKIDKVLRPRLEFICATPFKQIIAVLSGIVALTMIPLELVPFAAALPAAGIAISALGITTRDGISIIIGIALQLGAFYLVYSQLLA